MVRGVCEVTLESAKIVEVDHRGVLCGRSVHLIPGSKGDAPADAATADRRDIAERDLKGPDERVAGGPAQLGAKAEEHDVTDHADILSARGGSPHRLFVRR